jgi:hypothetical protein
MILLEAYVGFHRPRFRDEEGKIAPRAWFGHVEIWGYTRDNAWLFFDPQASGVHIAITHHHDEVNDMLCTKLAQCSLVLRAIPIEDGFRFPLHGHMTCASIIGAMLGQRAWLPAGLRRKLLRNGAEVIHDAVRLQREQIGQGGTAA